MEKMIPETEEAGLVQELVKRVEELEAENAALKEERRAVKVSALLKEGALDAEYILEKLGKDAEKKDFLEKAKERFPALFRREVKGVRLLTGGKNDQPLGFSQRQALFQARPEEYRRVYKKR